MTKKIRNSIIYFFVAILLVAQLSPIAYAIEIPSAPTIPDAPSAPSQPSAPSAPTAPDKPSHDNDKKDEDTQHDDDTNEDENDNSDPTPTKKPKPTTEPTQAPQTTPTPTAQQSQAANQNSGSGVGDVEIETGDATTTGVIDAQANNNLNTSPLLEDEHGGISIANTGNGANSDNNGSVHITDANTSIQNNSASVLNNLNQQSQTGDNTADGNVGNSSIETGDANTSGTIVTAVNTNVDAVAVSEFDVADDHQGDLVLDFASNCISGCGAFDTTVKNAGNGSGSNNNATVSTDTTDEIFQTNDATVENNLVLLADSGNNSASENTNGNSTITTGDANISANALTFANNNISGNVIYGVVNIFGDMVGDIIFPEELLTGCCTGNTTVTNNGNGTGSTNNAEVDQENSDLTFQTNDAVIDNILLLDSQTGNNSASGNTGGSSSIETGDSTVTAQVMNVANTNIDGGVWWLVLVNEAGNWIGKIMGSPDGQNFAGSTGTEFATDANGEITATNAGNGSHSDNSTTVSQNTTTTTVQDNAAHITNTLDLTANTGGNQTNDNTGGDNSITTGDSNIIANLVNFANNNITGVGKLIVTVVNVFGSWVGDFVTPGNEKQTTQATEDTHVAAIGGAEIVTNTSGSSSNSTNGSQSPTPTPTQSSHSNTSQSSPHVLAATKTKHTTPQNNTGDQGTNEDADTTVSSSEEHPQDVIVAGTKTANRKKISVNLAWLLIMVPCAILGFAIKNLAVIVWRKRRPY